MNNLLLLMVGCGLLWNFFFFFEWGGGIVVDSLLGKLGSCGLSWHFSE